SSRILPSSLILPASKTFLRAESHRTNNPSPHAARAPKSIHIIRISSIIVHFLAFAPPLPDSGAWVFYPQPTVLLCPVKGESLVHDYRGPAQGFVSQVQLIDLCARHQFDQLTAPPEPDRHALESGVGI